MRAIDAGRRRSGKGWKRDRYNGGTEYGVARQRFLVLLEKTGSFKTTCELIDDLVIWPPRFGRPPEKNLREWAYRYQRGEMEIDPKIRAVMEKQIENHSRWSLVGTAVRDAGIVNTLLGRLEQGEKLSQDETSLLTRLHNGAGFLYGTINGGRQPQQKEGISVGKLQIVASAPRRLPPGKKAKNVVEAVSVRELTDGA